MKHTPGPWELGHRDSTRAIIDSRGVYIGFVGGDEDARLIAAIAKAEGRS